MNIKLLIRNIFAERSYLSKCSPILPICYLFSQKKTPFQNMSLITYFFHLGGPINCKVGHWSEWSPCSKTCGIGESKKTREVVRKAKRGGNDCPPLGMISNKINTQIYTLCVSGCHYLVNLHVL